MKTTATMTPDERRTVNYLAQSGRLTPRQRRRIDHKRRHALAPFGPDLGRTITVAGQTVHIGGAQ